MSEEKKYQQERYIARPKPSLEVAERFETTLQAATGQITVTEGAERLKMPRNHFQMLMHRGLRGFLENVSPQPIGRRPLKSEREKELEARVESLEREIKGMEEQSLMIRRVMGMAADMTREQAQAWKRRAARRQKAKGNDPEEPGGDPTEVLAQQERRMSELGIRADIAAAAVGRRASPVRRWKHRRKA